MNDKSYGAISLQSETPPYSPRPRDFSRRRHYAPAYTHIYTYRFISSHTRAAGKELRTSGYDGKRINSMLAADWSQLRRWWWESILPRHDPRLCYVCSLSSHCKIFVDTHRKENDPYICSDISASIFLTVFRLFTVFVTRDSLII